jgi:hypothetical protein
MAIIKITNIFIGGNKIMRLKWHRGVQNSSTLKLLACTKVLLILVTIVLIGFGLKKDVVAAVESGTINGTNGNIVNWTIDDDGCLKVTGTGIIPYRKFIGYTNITTIVIGNGITEIQAEAFLGCTNLTSVNADTDSTLKIIGTRAFADCYKLTNCILPSNISELYSYIFLGDKNLKSFDLPDSITTIGYGIFKDCLNLESVKLSVNLTSIPPYTFEHCNLLNNVIIPNNVKKIDVSAFKDCIGLTSIRIPQNVTDIGDSAFSNCTQLETVEVVIADVPFCIKCTGTTFSYHNNNIHMKFFDKNGASLTGDSLVNVYNLYKNYQDGNSTNNNYNVTSAPGII